MSNMFSGCSNLKEIKGLNNFMTDNVTNMSGMFYSCSNLISLDLSNFKTDKINNMSYMFCRCSNLKELNINGFKYSENIYMKDIFEGINKTKSKLIVNDENLNNLFK